MIRAICLPITEEHRNDPTYQQSLKRYQDSGLLAAGLIITKLEDITPEEWAEFKHLYENYKDTPGVLPNQIKEYFDNNGGINESTT
jgi:hypothetical protein